MAEPTYSSDPLVYQNLFQYKSYINYKLIDISIRDLISNIILINRKYVNYYLVRTLVIFKN